MIKIQMLLCIVFTWNSYAQELISLVKGVENNHAIHMSYKKTPFICKPYGVESISELVLRTDVNSTCLGHLNEFRLAHPKEKSFAQVRLHVQQQYSVEGIDNSCLLHFSSGNSYSEALLAEGYARIPVGMTYRDLILDHRFNRALLRAKNTKAGMWSDENVIICFLLPPK